MFGPKKGLFPSQLNCAFYDYETTKRRGAAFYEAAHDREMVNSFHFPLAKMQRNIRKENGHIIRFVGLESGRRPG